MLYSVKISPRGHFWLIKTCKCKPHMDLNKEEYTSTENSQNFTKSLADTVQNVEKCLCSTQSLIIVLQNFEALIRTYWAFASLLPVGNLLFNKSSTHDQIANGKCSTLEVAACSFSISTMFALTRSIRIFISTISTEEYSDSLWIVWKLYILHQALK